MARNGPAQPCNCSASCSSGTPFVSGTIVSTHSSCSIIMPAKKAKMQAGTYEKLCVAKAQAQRPSDTM